VTLQAVPGNGRDKLVVLTDRGKQALRAGEEQYQRIEAEVAALIGAEGLATLQGLLGRLNAGFGHEEFQRLQDQV
jgi:DNA-binding MarR family transcriptional regulator